MLSEMLDMFAKGHCWFLEFGREKGVCGYIPDMDVSKNKGTPKWMVYNGKPY